MGRAISGILAEHHRLQELFRADTEEYWLALRAIKRQNQKNGCRRSFIDRKCPECKRLGGVAMNKVPGAIVIWCKYRCGWKVILSYA